MSYFPFTHFTPYAQTKDQHVGCYLIFKRIISCLYYGRQLIAEKENPPASKMQADCTAYCETD